jgi:hypothetical protein
LVLPQILGLWCWAMGDLAAVEHFFDALETLILRPTLIIALVIGAVQFIRAKLNHSRPKRRLRQKRGRPYPLPQKLNLRPGYDHGPEWEQFR